MENHHFLWENPLFQSGIFNSYVSLPEGISMDISMDHGKFLLQGPEEDLHGCTCSCPVITKARCFLWPEHHSKARPFPEL